MGAKVIPNHLFGPVERGTIVLLSVTFETGSITNTPTALAGAASEQYTQRIVSARDADAQQPWDLGHLHNFWVVGQ